MKKLYLSLLIVAFATAAHADSLVHVNVNTSSINGTAGSIDAQFNAGPGETQAATAEIVNFTTDGTVSAPVLTGEATGGTPPVALVLGNGVLTSSALDDYFAGFKFGHSISFDLFFTGPALNSPNGMSTGGSTFALSFFSDANGTIPALTSDPNGLAASLTINPDGSLSKDAVSSAVQFTPEPGSAYLLCTALLALGAFGALRRFAK